jgi:hypothetical protein
LQDIAAAAAAAGSWSISCGDELLLHIGGNLMSISTSHANALFYHLQVHAKPDSHLPSLPIPETSWHYTNGELSSFQQTQTPYY